jgi:hypothetical protein
MEMIGVNADSDVLHDDVRVKKEHRSLRRERRTVRIMVGLYCAHHHGTRTLCSECEELASYADRRLDRCPYGAEKPACTNCPIHCYRPEPRERMREVMRFAGPLMLARHPYLAIRHLLDDRREAPLLPSVKSRRSEDDAADPDRDILTP